MIFRNKNQRVAVLVDVQNLYYSANALFNAKVSYKNLLKLAVQDRMLTRAIAYTIRTEDYKEQGFFEALNEAGFEVKEKDLQVFSTGAKKGDWDVGIAMDAIRLGAKVDSIVLISGDGDYKPVVNYLQQSLGCLVEIIAFKKTTNKELIEIADDFVNMEDYKSTLLFKTASQRRPLIKRNTRRNQSTGSNMNSSTKPVSNPSQSVNLPANTISNNTPATNPVPNPGHYTYNN